MMAAACAAAGFAALPTAGASTLLVNWGGNYVAGNVGTPRGATNVNTTGYIGQLWGYNATVPISPGIGSSYSGTSAKFYGVAQLTTKLGGANGSHQVQIQNNAEQDRIYVQTRGLNVNTLPGDTANAQGFFFWNKEDFLDGESLSEPLQLSSLSELYLNAPYGRVSNSTVRFAVQSGGVWYLSEKALVTGEKLATALGSITLTELSESAWAQWGVQASPTSLLDAAPGTFDVLGSTLNDITAVGFYYDATYIKSNAVMLGFSEFRVTATTIPEPGTTAMLGGAALLLIGFAAARRARQRK